MPQRLVAFNGVELTVSEWAKKLKITRTALWHRLREIDKGKMTLADALRDPAGRKLVEKRLRVTWVRHDGEVLTIDQVARRYKVTQATVRNWIKGGHLKAYRERPLHCGACGGTDHTARVCPKLYLERGGRKVPFAPPDATELEAVGVPKGATLKRAVVKTPRRLR